jgi:hypothetical protein
VQFCRSTLPPGVAAFSINERPQVSPGDRRVTVPIFLMSVRLPTSDIPSAMIFQRKANRHVSRRGL